MHNLAIIPARGGSKRIPHKNIKFFLGKPIIAYSIEVALESNLFEEVIVSTDDDKIAQIAKQYGAKVPFMRSNLNSNDNATTMDALNEVISWYKNNIGKIFESVCCIYPTAPLVKVDYLHRGYNILIRENLASVFPIVPFSYPVWRGLKKNKEGRIEFVWPEFQNCRTQEFETIYHDAGQWYWFNPQKITNSLFTENSGSIIFNEEDVQDIDNIVDWKLAEMKYKLIKENPYETI